jgi:hypothetical protein
MNEGIQIGLVVLGGLLYMYILLIVKNKKDEQC